MPSPPPVSVRIHPPTISYPITFAPLAALPSALTSVGLSPGRLLGLTDETVQPMYGETVWAALRHAGWHVLDLTVPAGEASKSLACYEEVVGRALNGGIARDTVVLGLGGGVVGDLAGFVAATLMRGLPLVHVPTTVIAQVDSAIGGKTGVNHAVGKNLIGAFHQPRLVHIDTAVLQTLPVREYESGLAEVLKYAFIADPAFIDDLEVAMSDVRDREAGSLARIVHRSAACKAEIVMQDERENGRRALLNFGHTFGHAIEKVAGYGRFTHGEAVALGMQAALHVSHHLTPELPFERGLRLLDHLPTPPLDLPIAALTDAMQADKKKRAGRLHYVLLRSLGAAYVTPDVPAAAIAEAWAFVKSRTHAGSRETNG